MTNNSVKERLISYIARNKIDIDKDISFDEQRRMSLYMGATFYYIRKVLHMIRVERQARKKVVVEDKSVGVEYVHEKKYTDIAIDKFVYDELVNYSNTNEGLGDTLHKILIMFQYVAKENDFLSAKAYELEKLNKKLVKRIKDIKKGLRK